MTGWGGRVLAWFSSYVSHTPVETYTRLDLRPDTRERQMDEIKDMLDQAEAELRDTCYERCTPKEERP